MGDTRDRVRLAVVHAELAEHEHADHPDARAPLSEPLAVHAHGVNCNSWLTRNRNQPIQTTMASNKKGLPVPLRRRYHNCEAPSSEDLGTKTEGGANVCIARDARTACRNHDKPLRVKAQVRRQVAGP